MKLLRLLIVCCALAFLLPAWAEAAPSYPGWQCDLSPEALKIIHKIPGIGQLFPATEEVQVDIAPVRLTLRICAPTEDGGTAQRMLALMERALPILNKHAGVDYVGADVRQVAVVSIEEMHANNANGLVDTNGVIFLHPRSSDWVVVHEAAHLWANRKFFSERWLREGYADYLTGRVMSELHRADQPVHTEAGCDGVALLSNTFVPSNCPYAVGARVLRQLIDTVGEDQFHQTLRTITQNGRTASGYELLIALERAANQDLAPLMQYSIFPPDLSAQLEERRALRELLWQAYQLATPLQLEPPAWIADALDRLEFEGPRAWLERLIPFFTNAGEVNRRCQELSLPCESRWSSLPTDLAELDQRRTQIEIWRALLDQLASLDQLARSLDLRLPHALVESVATFQPSAADDLNRALANLNAGRALDDRCGHIDAPCGDDWRKLWNDGDQDGVAAHIAELNDVLNEIAAIELRCNGFAADCRAIWRPAFERAGATAARQSLTELDQLLNVAAEIEQRCGDLRAACHQLWIAALHARQIEGAQAEIDRIRSLLQQGDALEQRCRDDGRPCAESWRAIFRQNADIAATQQRIVQVEGVLGLLRQADGAARHATDAMWIGTNPAGRINVLLDTAAKAFAEGDLDRAQAAARNAIDMRAAAEKWERWLPPFLLATVVAACGVLFWAFKRPRRRRATRPALNNNDLLAALLAQPPGANSKPRRWP